MGIIEDLIKRVTGGNGVSDVVDNVKKTASGFGLSGYGDISEIINIFKDVKGFDISQLTELVTKNGLDINLLGQIGMIAQGKFDFADNEMINSVKTQIMELDGGAKDTVLDLVSKLPVDKSLLEKIIK